MAKLLTSTLVLGWLALITALSPIANIDLGDFNSNQGFIINGAGPYDGLGKSVSSAGDINGDGINDIIIGASLASPLERSQAGSVYVLFGPQNGTFNIDAVNITNNNEGFTIMGANAGDQLGCSVSKAGDINGDGIDDIVLGAEGAGKAYVIFGSIERFSDIDLLNGFSTTQGFTIIDSADNHFGASVSGAGDVSGDGIDDIIIGAYLTNSSGRAGAGSAYVIFGTRSEISDIYILKDFNNSQGYQILGGNAGDNLGISVSDAGDINGDGISDIILGAQWASPQGRPNAGVVYAIFGNPNRFSDIDLNNPLANEGFRIFGANVSDQLGVAVSRAGDINADGIEDIVLGTPNTMLPGRQFGGSAYVVFGKRKESSDIDLSKLQTNQGFTILGGEENDNLGISVSNAGDVNGDGIHDIIIGAWTASPLGRNLAGCAYVILGKREGLCNIDLGNGLDLTEGFMILGDDTQDHIGVTVSSAGDINEDGIDDLLIGSTTASPLGRTQAGMCYTILSSNPLPSESIPKGHIPEEDESPYSFVVFGLLTGVILAGIACFVINKRSKEKERQASIEKNSSLLFGADSL